MAQEHRSGLLNFTTSQANSRHRELRQNTGRALVGSIVLLTWLLSGLACNFSNTSKAPTAAVTPTITPTPAVEFLQMTPPARDPARAVLVNVLPDAQSNIAEIWMMLPPQLAAAQIMANGVAVAVESLPEDPGGTRINLVGKVAASKVELVFLEGSQQIATCSVDIKNLLTPTGDCGW